MALPDGIAGRSFGTRSVGPSPMRRRRRPPRPLADGVGAVSDARSARHARRLHDKCRSTRRETAGLGRPGHAPDGFTLGGAAMERRELLSAGIPSPQATCVMERFGGLWRPSPQATHVMERSKGCRATRGRQSRRVEEEVATSPNNCGHKFRRTGGISPALDRAPRSTTSCTTGWPESPCWGLRGSPDRRRSH